jgi:hypothetical protein
VRDFGQRRNHRLGLVHASLAILAAANVIPEALNAKSGLLVQQKVYFVGK